MQGVSRQPEEPKAPKSPVRRRLIASCVLLIACPALMLILSHGPTALRSLHRSISKGIAWALSTITSIVPFAVWDILILATLVLVPVMLAWRWRKGLPVLPVLSGVLLSFSLGLFLFVGWACNHYAPQLATELGLEVREYSTEELAQTTQFYLEEAARLAPEVPRDENGELERQDFYELARKAGSSYASLGQSYDIFKGPTTRVKALLIWGEPLLYSGHTGIYFAPTGESGIPLNCAVADMPFIMCHEAAHRLCLAGEDEANFAAILACTTSDDARFSYSGNFNAFSYCYSALYAVNPDRARQVMEDALAAEVGKNVLMVAEDYNITHEYYDAYNGPFEEVGRTVNDGYLKSFGEDDGVRSYGLVVDYLIAWHLS